MHVYLLKQGEPTKTWKNCLNGADRNNDGLSDSKCNITGLPLAADLYMLFYGQSHLTGQCV